VFSRKHINRTSLLTLPTHYFIHPFSQVTGGQSTVSHSLAWLGDALYPLRHIITLHLRNSDIQTYSHILYLKKYLKNMNTEGHLHSCAKELQIVKSQFYFKQNPSESSESRNSVFSLHKWKKLKSICYTFYLTHCSRLVTFDKETWGQVMLPADIRLFIVEAFVILSLCIIFSVLLNTDFLKTTKTAKKKIFCIPSNSKSSAHIIHTSYREMLMSCLLNRFYLTLNQAI